MEYTKNQIDIAISDLSHITKNRNGEYVFLNSNYEVLNRIDPCEVINKFDKNDNAEKSYLKDCSRQY